MKRHRKLAVSELKPVYYAVGWNGKVLTLTMEHGSKVLERATIRVFDEPSTNARRRLTAGLVKAGLMSQSDVVLEALTVPSVRLSAYHVDRGFVEVAVGFRPPTRRRMQKNHRDTRRTNRPLGNPL